MRKYLRICKKSSNLALALFTVVFFSTHLNERWSQHSITKEESHP